ncbi:MAG: hypothetical protein ACREIF_09595 [Chthoniobacterales bacterium]
MADGFEKAGRWYVDHLLLDQDAIPTLVEVKRSSDTRIRREVVGQILEYASNAVVYWPVEKIQADFQRECERTSRTVEEVLREQLEVEPDDIGEFWNNVKTNLQAGKVRMIIAADQISAELRRIVEFLNSQMDPAVILAVEIRQFVGEQDSRILVPTVYGQTEEAQLSKSAGLATKLWDQKTILEEVRGSYPDAFPIAEGLVKWGQLNSDGFRPAGTGARGSFRPFIMHGAKEFPLFGVWSDGFIELYLKDYLNDPAFSSESKSSELRAKLAGLGIPSGIDLQRKYPTFPARALAENGRLELFIKTIEWIVTQVRT